MIHLRTGKSRRLFFATLYLCEGAPIGFIWWALPAQLRAAGVPLPEITPLTAALALPWALKFLWAPCVDLIRSDRWSLRSWIVVSQFLMGASLLPLLLLDYSHDLPLLFGFLLAHAFAAATQDVSIDALCIASTPEEEHGSVNGWMQAGMLTGRGLFGGGTLILANVLGQSGFVLFLVALIWTVALIVAFATGIDPKPPTTDRTVRLSRFLEAARRALRGKPLWFGFVVAAVGGAGFEAVGAIAGPFMIDRGVGLAEVGFFFTLPAIGGIITGALVGGLASDRIGRRRSVALFLSLLALSIIMLAAFDFFYPDNSAGLLPVILTAVYFCIGLYTAASYAFFMNLTDPRLGATQFSAFMGVTNLCESWSAFTVGRMVPVIGYPGGIVIMGVVSLAALPFVLMRSDNKKAAP